MLKAWLNTLCLLCVSLTAHTAFADEILFPRAQVHARTGMVTGSLSGPISDTFSSAPAFELEYEQFETQRQSLLFRTYFAMDQASAKTRYAFAGFGQRFYARNTIASPVTSEQDGTFVSINPKKRYFWGWDAGFASVLVQEVTDTFDAVSTMLDLGAHGGMSYRMSNNFHMVGLGRISYGYGFSSVSVNAIVISFSFGGSYFF